MWVLKKKIDIHAMNSKVERIAHFRGIIFSVVP